MIVTYFRKSLAGVLATTEARSGSILCILLDSHLSNPVSSKLSCEASGRTILMLRFSKIGLDVTGSMTEVEYHTSRTIAQ
jgi:hypothetical protein